MLERDVPMSQTQANEANDAGFSFPNTFDSGWQCRGRRGIRF